MTTKADILTAVQACADASGDSALRIALGAPGSQIKFRGETKATGSAYDVPGFIDCLIEGVADVMDTQITAAVGAATAALAQYFDAYDSVGGTNIDAGWTDVPLGTQRQITSDFTHTAPSPDVTIDTDGVYLVIYAVGTEITVGSARSDSEARLQTDTGGGYATVSGTVGRIYNRQLGLGEGTCVRAAILALSATNRVKVQAKRESGGDTIALITEGSGITIRRLT